VSEADRAQNAHDVPTAIWIRLEAVKADTATPHDHHQLGVLLSELAESARRIGNPSWEQQAELLLRHAQHHFAIANGILEIREENLALHAGIQCDALLTQARGSWFAQPIESAATVVVSGKVVAMVIKLLETRLEDRRNRNKPAIQHQLAIAFSFAARLSWGRALGYRANEARTTALGYSELAWTYFQREDRSLDNHRAFRSHILTMALAHGANGESKTRRALAAEARRSAIAAKDASHARRARIIWWFGNRGERWLRKRRDGKLITEVCTALAAD
jgi:hypothetical protein